MPDHTYVFIDGEYLRRTHREAMQEFFGVNGELELSPIMRQAEATRVYFYDAIDYTRRENESEQEWEARVLRLEQFFSYVRSLSGFHVRPGSVTRGKRRQQKEVDVLLAVDMLTQGLTRTMGKAVLIAGDVDFRPVVEALVEHGVFVQVWYHRSSFAQELPGAADFGYEVRFRDLYDWNSQPFKASHKIPSESLFHSGSSHNGHMLKVGLVNGLHAELWEIPDRSGGDWQRVWIEVNRYRNDSIVITDHDLSLIERYVAVQYGPLEWTYTSEGSRILGAGA